MEIKEAIEYIKWMQEKFYSDKSNEACNMAIAALEQQGEDNEWCLDCKEYDKEQHCCHRFTKVIRQAVEEHQRKWSDSKWIPVTERLPEEDCDCRVTVKNGLGIHVFDCSYNKGEKRFESWYPYQDEFMPIPDVTAWKPIEAPYQEDKA